MLRTQINTKTIRQNIKTLRSKLNAGVKFCAVLKANAYGLGDTVIAPAIHAQVDWFSVVSIKEAVRLREVARVTKPILLLGICDDIRTAIKYNLTVTVTSFEELRNICKQISNGERLSIHIKVNTGMNRFGINSPWQLKRMLMHVQKFPQITIGGLYTHMSHEIDNMEYIDRQLKKFVPFRAMMRRANPCAIIHAACSGAAEYKPAQFDMVRIGKSMYGGFAGYKTALTITTKVVAVQNIQKGAGVSYKARFIADRNMTIGIVSCGYADLGYLFYGYDLNVYINKKPRKILGVVCMDNFAIDVSDIASPLGKTVTILGGRRGASIMDFVRIAGKTSCWLFCSLNLMRADVTVIK